MLEKLTKSATAYHTLYDNTSLLVQRETAEQENENDARIVGDIATLNRANIHVILVEKENPRSRRVIESELRHADFVDPHSIQFSARSGVEAIDLGRPRPLVILQVPHAVDVNDVTLQIVRQHETDQRINEVLLLDESGGIRDRDGNLVSLITEAGVEQLLRNQHPRVTLDRLKRRQMMQIRKILQPAGKVVMTTHADLRREIEDWKGSGSLAFHTSSMNHSLLEPEEGEIFDAMNQAYVKEGVFRERSDKELDILKHNHYMLRAKRSPVGGFTVYPHDDGWLEISALWSGYIGNGVGDHLLRAAKERARTMGSAASNTNVFALSTDSHADLFTRAGFQAIGTVAEAKKRRDIDLPSHVRSYAIDGRNPQVFLYTERIDDVS